MSSRPLPKNILYKKVVIRNSGHLYSSYEEMANRFHFKKWVRDRGIKEGIIGKVVGISRHEDDSDEIILGISCDLGEFVIGINGIEVLEEQEDEDYFPKTEFFNVENLVL